MARCCDVGEKNIQEGTAEILKAVTADVLHTVEDFTKINHSNKQRVFLSCPLGADPGVLLLARDVRQQ